jgi:hypothetical protein
MASKARAKTRDEAQEPDPYAPLDRTPIEYTWAGQPGFQCRHCPFNTLEEVKYWAHVNDLAIHPDPVRPEEDEHASSEHPEDDNSESEPNGRGDGDVDGG